MEVTNDPSPAPPSSTTESPRAPTPHQEGPPSPPTKKSFAAVAANGPPPAPWKQVPKKTKAPKKAPLFAADYTKVNREVVIELASPIPDTLTTDTILAAANMALSPTGIKMVLVRRTPQSNLVLTTSPNTPAALVEPYFESLAFALRPLQLDPTRIKINSRWSKFIIHNIPTNLGDDLTTGNAVASAIMESYPQIALCQIPRWLTTLDKRTMKAQSSMVLSFPGSHCAASLGLSSLMLFNRVCRLVEYFPSGPTTQCRTCNILGHHQSRCPSTGHCAVCAGPHLTGNHKCTSCNGGHKCTHPPIKCVNCLNSLGHKASDPACPARAKARLLAKPTAASAS